MTVKHAVILTGVSRSGKSTYAKQLNETQQYKVINFDNFYDYANPGAIEDNFNKLKNLIGVAEKIVLDGYWNDSDRYFVLFKKLICENVQSVVTLASLPVIAKRRNDFFRKKGYGKFGGEGIIEIIVYVNNLIDRVNFKETKFFDTSDDTFKEIKIANPKEMNEYLKIINKPVLLDYMKMLPNYDQLYQDIEILDFVGYSKSYLTWERIKDLVDWKDKRVKDLGCNHGYFTFKINKAGAAKIIGCDCNINVLNTVELIYWLMGYGYPVEQYDCERLKYSSCNPTLSFRYWESNDELAECDIILCLNVLHHFTNPDLTLSQMKCRQAIFEINITDLPLVEKYFKIVKTVESHRPNRIIILGEK